MIGVLRITRATIVAALGLRREKQKQLAGGVVRLSTITGQPRARNFTHIHPQGRLVRCEGRPGVGFRALPPGGCMARFRAGETYACELCVAAWKPAADVLPPCATPCAAYEQYLRDQGAE